jgi:hypothetical protein
MLGMVLLSAAIGVVIGTRSKVLFLGPVIIAGLLFTIGVGIAAGWRCSAIALAVLATLIVLQLGYLAGCLLRNFSRTRGMDGTASPIDSTARRKDTRLVRT